MIQDLPRRQIAIELVRKSYQSLGPYLAQGERVWHCLGDLAIVAMLLDESEMFTRLFDLMQNAPEEYRWLKRSFQQEQVEKSFPIYQESTIVEMIRKCAKSESHLALALERQYSDAISIAKSEGNSESERMLEEIASMQALFGDFGKALGTIETQVTPQFRQRGALLVLVIELFRNGRFEQARTILHKLESSNQDVWNRAGENFHIAMSLIGRLPWQGYPFPDW